MITESLVNGKFKIENNQRHDDCELYCYINIDGYCLIRVVQTDWDEDEEFGGADHNDAGIELTTELAIKLRDELTRLIDANAIKK